MIPHASRMLCSLSHYTRRPRLLHIALVTHHASPASKAATGEEGAGEQAPPRTIVWGVGSGGSGATRLLDSTSELVARKVVMACWRLSVFLSSREERGTRPVQTTPATPAA